MKSCNEWIFTFGCGQQYAGHYVRLTGDYETAREKMFFLFGEDWCLQYSPDVWAKTEKRLGNRAETEMPLTDVHMAKLAEWEKMHSV